MDKTEIKFESEIFLKSKREKEVQLVSSEKILKGELFDEYYLEIKLSFGYFPKTDSPSKIASLQLIQNRNDGSNKYFSSFSS